jgi:hypothetical protein
MHDQRIKSRALLGLEDLQHSGFVVGVGRQAVDRFGGDGHDLAFAQEICGDWLMSVPMGMSRFVVARREGRGE